MARYSAIVAAFRAHWAERFVDVVTFELVADLGPLNEATFEYDATIWTPVLVNQAALIRPDDDPRRVEVIEENQSVSHYHVFMDATAAAVISPDDRCTIVSTEDGTIVPGTVGKVIGKPVDSYGTRADILIEVNEGGGTGP